MKYKLFFFHCPSPPPSPSLEVFAIDTMGDILPDFFCTPANTHTHICTSILDTVGAT